ncbi:MAG: LysM peptidoglycan-binding domain-containing protein [Pseudomonadota bacterium]
MIKAAFLATVGTGVVAAGAVYTGVIQPAAIVEYFQAGKAPIQVLANAPAASDAKQAEVETPAVTPPEPETAPEQPDAAVPVAPAFDVLRVEKDGSILIAGRGPNDAQIDVLDASGAVVASGKAGPSGDFVVLPDQPLKPGDHVLALRATTSKGVVIASAETGIIRIPERGDEDVLALVTKDNEATRVVVKPQSLQPEAPVTAETETASEPKAEPEAKVAEAPEASETEQPEQPQSAEGEPAAPEVAAIAPAPAPQAEPLVPETTEAAKEEAADEPKAETAPEPVVEPQPAPAAPQVLVEAVEVENGSIFVAGSVKNGVPVRVYIDGKVLGLTRGTPNNRFLLTRKFALEPGNHTVRADVVDQSTGEVLSRAEVALLHDPQPVVAAAEPEKKEETVAAADEPKPAPEAAPKTAPAPAPETAPVEQAAVEPTVQNDAAPEPPVIRTGTTVIIKPGDNLWRISRKSYGEGIRYTTIYNANRDQIRDPNRIYVGQIFKIPENSEAE